MALPLVDPVVESSVGLVSLDRDRLPPLGLATFECARITKPTVSKPLAARVPR